MKKIITFLLSVIMLLQSFCMSTIANAATNANDVYLYNWERSNVATVKDNAKSLIVSNFAVSGSNSLYIQHNDSLQTWRMISVAQSVEIPAGSYTLSFWVAGDYDGSKCTILFEGNNWQTHKFDSSEPAGNPYTVTEGTGGWKKFEKTVTINNTNGRILIASDGNTEGFYIDDIQLIKKGTSVNLIKNGGFEEKGTSVEPEEPNEPTEPDEEEDEVQTPEVGDDAYLYNWERSNTATVKDNAKSLIVSNFAVSGSNSLYIQHNDSLQTWRMISVAQSVEIPAGSYTLSFWVAGDYDGGKCTILFEGNNWQTHKFDSSEPAGNPYTVTEGADGWKKFEKTVTINNTNGRISIASDGNTEGFYIDDIQLIKEGTSVNLIKNGSFEEKGTSVEPDEPDEPETNKSPYAPSNLMLSSTETRIVLNWINPKEETLERVSVYEITDGQNKLLSNSIDTTASKTIYFEVTDANDKKSHQYRIEFKFSDKGIVTYYIGGIASAISSKQYGGWDVVNYASGAAGYCPGIIAIDNSVSMDGGNASLKFSSNIDRSYPDMASNIYMYAATTANLEQGETYQVSFWSKGENVMEAPVSHFSWVNYDDHESSFTELIGTYDWKQNVQKYTCTDKTKLYFIIEGVCDALWIDNVEIYKLDENGNVPDDAENLVANGDFEGLCDNNVSEIKDLETEITPDGVSLSWSIASEDYEEIRLYEKSEDTYQFRGTIGKNIDNIVLSNLNVGTEYTFRLVPVNADGVCGAYKEATFTTNLPDYEIKEVVLRKDGQIKENLDGAGNYSMSFYVKNNAITAGMNVVQFVAIYDEDGVLYDKIHSTTETIAKTDIGESFSEIITPFVLPEGLFTVEYFVFDGRNTLNIIGEPNPHKIFEYAVSIEK